MNRRKYVLLATSATIGSLAGCFADDGTEDDDDTDDESDENPDGGASNEDGTDETGSETDDEGSETETRAVDPEVTGGSYPDPQAVSIHDEHLSGDRFEHFIEIQNTGDAGSIEYTLVWLEDQQDDVFGPNSAPVLTQDRYFDADERREVSVIEDRPDQYDAYGFRLYPGEVTLEVENSGGEGRVNVMLLEGSEIVEEATLLVDADSTATVSFDTGDHLDWDEIDFEAEPA